MAEVSSRNWFWIAAAVVITLPWFVLRLMNYHDSAPLVALFSGLAIVGAAFLLSWAAEVAQMEISQALAVAVLSLIAILPEYAVDMYFAWQAARDPAYSEFAIANMTGANRLLIGVGWSLIVILHWARTRQREVVMNQDEGLELGTMALATVYAFILPFKANVSLLDALVLIGLFAIYAWSTAQNPPEEPELVGPAALVGKLPRSRRRLAIVALFAFAALAILVSAEPFAEGLVETGQMFGIDEFLLVQWLAPLASETPEFIVVTLFVLHGRPVLGLRAMLSSKVNQWTLLVGMLPLVYAISLGAPRPMAFDARQVEEIFLTAAQSIFAVMLLANYRFTLVGAALLFFLFLLQFLIPDIRLTVGYVYLGLAALMITSAARRRGLGRAFGQVIEPFRRKAKKVG